MLKLTPAAATLVAEARRERGLPDTVGLRLFAQGQSGAEMALGMTFAELPAEDDEVTVQDGTRMFLAPEVVGPLSSAALDVDETPEGVALVLTEQEPG